MLSKEELEDEFGTVHKKGFKISELVDHLNNVKECYGDLVVEICDDYLLEPIIATMLTAGDGDLGPTGKPMPSYIYRKLMLIAMTDKFIAMIDKYKNATEKDDKKKGNV